MARKSLLKMDHDPIERLKVLIPSYKMNKTEMDTYKKAADRFNAEIKSIMLEQKLPEFTVGDLRATCTISERQDFIEEALVAKVKELKLRGVVKKKEYVDMDALESAIYNGKLNAAELVSCQVTKEVVTLRVGPLKKEKIDE